MISETPFIREFIISFMKNSLFKSAKTNKNFTFNSWIYS